ERFTFATSTAVVELGTYLYLGNTTNGLRVVGVGELISDGQDLIRFELFADNAQAKHLRRHVEPMECLEAFMRYGIQKVPSRRTMIRPAITVLGISTLESVLHGYEAAVIRQALESAGAWVLTFE